MTGKDSKFYRLYAERINRLRERLKQIDGVRLFDRKSGIYDFDPTRITMCVNGVLSSEFMDIMRRKHHIELEMACPQYIIAISTVCDREEDLERCFLSSISFLLSSSATSAQYFLVNSALSSGYIYSISSFPSLLLI